MNTRLSAGTEHLRVLGVLVRHLFGDLAEPQDLELAIVNVLLGAAFTALAVKIGMLEGLFGQVIYSLVIAGLTLSILSTLRYHLKLRLRWARIRKASRAPRG